MTEESSVRENVRELQREARRLERLRLAEVHELPRQDEPGDDIDPDPKEAA
jgi:hypothetical protein